MGCPRRCVSRIAQTDFDDDGHPVARRFGVQGPTALMTETRSYDGLGRLASVVDTEGLRHVLKYSRRDVLVQVQTNNPAVGPAVLWTDTYAYDAFARPWKKSTNGTLVYEVARRPGGQVYASFSYGKRPVYTTYDADGAPVWSEDADGEVVQVLTGRPDSRVVTSTTVRKQGSTVAATSVVSVLDVLGLPTTVTETGAGTGQARLSRPKVLTRNPMGLVTMELDADGATSDSCFAVQAARLRRPAPRRRSGDESFRKFSQVLGRSKRSTPESVRWAARRTSAKASPRLLRYQGRSGGVATGNRWAPQTAQMTRSE
jgi:hypothetical protein